jgi:hypothetical protein
MAPVIGRISHMPPRALRRSAGGSISLGAGTLQLGGDHTVPSGLAERRSNWHVARAMLVPPLKNSASITLMRFPSRTERVVTSILSKPGRRYMSTVSRAGTKSGPPWHVSISWARSPMTTRP